MTSSTAAWHVVGDEVQLGVGRRRPGRARRAGCRRSRAPSPSTGRRACRASTIGTGRPLPVWVSVSSSNVSSSVPKPPGRQTKPLLSLISISLRVKKYFMLTYLSSPAMTGLAPCSNGSRIDTPIDLLAAGALHRRLHDPRAGAGDDHPACFGELGRRRRGPACTAGRPSACGPSRRSSPWGRRGTARTS